MFQRYRGERFCQDVAVSPTELVVSLLFSFEISSFYSDLIYFFGFDLSSFYFFCGRDKAFASRGTRLPMR